MITGLDIELIKHAWPTLLIQSTLLLIALVCGLGSLLIYHRPSYNPKRGRRLAVYAIAIGVSVETWIVAFFTPWRSFNAQLYNARSLLFLPLVPLQVGLCALALWGAIRIRSLSGTGRLAVVVAVIAITTAGVLGLQQWDRRRERLHKANHFATYARRLRDDYVAEMKCLDHWRQGQRCKRCSNRRPDLDYAKKILQDSEYYSELERTTRWSINHLDSPLPIPPIPPSLPYPPRSQLTFPVGHDL